MKMSVCYGSLDFEVLSRQVMWLKVIQLYIFTKVYNLIKYKLKHIQSKCI